MATSVTTLAIVRASRPTFRCKADKVAFAVYAVALANGLKLLAVGDRADEPGITSKDPEAPVSGWNSGEGHYSFLFGYQADGIAGKVLVKCLVMDGTLMVNFLHTPDEQRSASKQVPGASQPESIELPVDKYATDDADLSTSYKKLDELAAQVQSVLQQIIPQSQGKAAAAQSSKAQAPPPEPPADPLRLPDKPGFRRPPGFGPAPGIPLRVGGEDIMPLGGRMPGLGGMEGPGHGFTPGGPTGGGMHVGPGHPYFADRMRHPELLPGGGVMGGPRPGRGPGMRWDPISPDGLPGYRSEDFHRDREQGLNDIGPPPPGRGADWDDMYG